MPNLVMLWKMSPLRGGVRAGARLWARGPACRSWAATGPKPKPGGAGGALGPLRGEARQPAQVTLFSTYNYNTKGQGQGLGLELLQQAFCRAN
jgi:hypothetical protein